MRRKETLKRSFKFGHRVLKFFQISALVKRAKDLPTLRKYSCHFGDLINFFARLTSPNGFHFILKDKESKQGRILMYKYKDYFIHSL